MHPTFPAMAEALATLTVRDDVAWWRDALTVGPSGYALRQDGVLLARDFFGTVEAMWRDPSVGDARNALRRAVTAGLLPDSAGRGWWRRGYLPWEEGLLASTVIQATPWWPHEVATLAGLGAEAVARAEELAVRAAGAAAETADGDVFLVAWRLVNPRGLHGLLTLREVERAGDTEREPDEDEAEDELARLGLPVLAVEDGRSIVLALPCLPLPAPRRT